ncbi:hypothetical protein V6N13_034839 [Hibiscus sabdariffa]
MSASTAVSPPKKKSPVRLCMSKHTSKEVGWWSGKVSSEEPKAKRYAGIKSKSIARRAEHKVLA